MQRNPKKSRNHHMKTKKTPLSVSSLTQPPSAVREEIESSNKLGRRSFLKGLGIAGASLAPVAALLMTEGTAGAQELRRRFGRGLTEGDVNILRFLAAAEILETDLWQQYNELGGVQDSEVPGGSGSKPYTDALVKLDADMPQYIHDNTDDENSHQMFLNAFLKSVGAQPVDLENFRTLPSSQASGADKTKKRLTNLTQLTVDTSWYTRYRSTENPDLPDLDATFAQAVNIVNQKAIPTTDGDVTNPEHIQAIANTAAFHFATIEQGGSSLYGSFIPKATTKVVLRILYAIGGTEIAHFQTWHDKAGNAVSDPLAPLTDPISGLTFPNLNMDPGGELFQTNLIMPEPCDFIRNDEGSSGLPHCSIIRPTLTKNAGAVAAANFLTNMGLFIGQSQEFHDTLFALARAADNARRQLEEQEDDLI